MRPLDDYETVEESGMIKFEYKPRAPDADWGITFDPPAVESLSMTLGDDVTWNEAVCEFQNFLRAAGYVIPYDFEEEGNLRFTKDETNELIEALEEAVYLLDPTDEDTQKKGGVYRIMTALEKVREKIT